MLNAQRSNLKIRHSAMLISFHPSPKRVIAEMRKLQVDCGRVMENLQPSTNFVMPSADTLKKLLDKGKKLEVCVAMACKAAVKQQLAEAK